MPLVSAQATFDGRSAPLSFDPSTEDWPALSARLAALFGLSEYPIEVTYIDDDSDRIFISSTEELRDLAASLPKSMRFELNLSGNVPDDAWEAVSSAETVGFDDKDVPKSERGGIEGPSGLEGKAERSTQQDPDVGRVSAVVGGAVKSTVLGSFSGAEITTTSNNTERTTASAPPPTGGPNALWYGVICDGCGEDPLRGTR